MRGAINVGVSADELFEALLQVGLYAGVPRALNAIRVLREVEAG